MQGLIGKKLGMTQVFDENGVQVPVTVIQAGPCVVVQRKTAANDGYEAVQLGFVDQKEQRLTKAIAGHFKKAGVAPKRVLHEIDVDGGEELKAGDTLNASVFEGVTHVDVSGVTKGKGFQGVVRRHGMVGGKDGHGSMMHRRVGSIGNRTWPARVFKNKRLPGQMGNVNVTTQNLRIVQVRADDSVLLVEGAVPGPVGAIVVVKKAIKKAAKTS
jgi:large subunit ribosomal protein L3